MLAGSLAIRFEWIFLKSFRAQKKKRHQVKSEALNRCRRTCRSRFESWNLPSLLVPAEAQNLWPANKSGITPLTS
jgi:hypothetical protein